MCDNYQACREGGGGGGGGVSRELREPPLESLKNTTRPSITQAHYSAACKWLAAVGLGASWCQ